MTLHEKLIVMIHYNPPQQLPSGNPPPMPSHPPLVPSGRRWALSLAGNSPSPLPLSSSWVPSCRSYIFSFPPSSWDFLSPRIPSLGQFRSSSVRLHPLRLASLFPRRRCSRPLPPVLSPSLPLKCSPPPPPSFLLGTW